jgi:hypothetical protein
MIRRSEFNFPYVYEQQTKITTGVVCKISSNAFGNYSYVGAKPKATALSS